MPRYCTFAQKIRTETLAVIVCKALVSVQRAIASISHINGMLRRDR